MSGSGIFYAPAQISAMDAAISRASDALEAGGAQGVSDALAIYYGVQITNPANGSLMRGYAALAQAVATNTGIGVIPNDEVRSAVGLATYTELYRADLAFQLAVADRNAITNDAGQVPTLSEVADYHASVFAGFGIPITAWGGTAYAALGQDFTLGRATEAERATITTPRFSALSASDVSASLWNLLAAGERHPGADGWYGGAAGALSIIGLDEMAQGKFGPQRPLRLQVRPAAPLLTACRASLTS